MHKEGIITSQVMAAFIPDYDSEDVPPEVEGGEVLYRFSRKHEIARGGCGVVYKGFREDNRDDRVAVKVITWGHLTEDEEKHLEKVISREILLENMDHPNILKVLHHVKHKTSNHYSSQ